MHFSDVDMSAGKLKVLSDFEFLEASGAARAGR